MSLPEFSRPVRADRIGTAREELTITADAAECAALSRRFALRALDALSARVFIWRDGADVRLEGRFDAKLVQSCVASGAPVPATVSEDINIRFARLAEGLPEEVELDADDCDVMEFDGQAVDAGEAVAQSLSLALNPYPRAPDADKALKAAGIVAEEEAGAFGALAALRDQLARK